LMTGSSLTTWGSRNESVKKLSCAFSRERNKCKQKKIKWHTHLCCRWIFHTHLIRALNKIW
jgi:hypothetical protein